MRRGLRDNSLSLVMFGLFAAFLLFMSLAGQRQYNEAQAEHGESTVGYAEYLTTGHFVEAVFENWESEFLQMGIRAAHRVPAPEGLTRVQEARRRRRSTRTFARPTARTPRGWRGPAG